MDRHNVTDDQDHHVSSHASEEGESTPSVLDNLEHDSQRVVAGTSSNVITEDSNTVYSSLTEPTQKRQRQTEVQFDEEIEISNLLGRLTGDVSTSAIIEKLIALQESEPPIPNSDQLLLIQPSIEGGISDSDITRFMKPSIQGGTEESEFEVSANVSSEPMQGLGSDNPGVPFPNVCSIESTDHILVIQPLASETQGLPPPSEPELEVSVNPMYASNFMQHASQSPDRSLATSGVGSASRGDIQVTAPQRMTNAAQTNSVDPRVGGEEPSLPRTRLFMVKNLSKSDIENIRTGIKLPKKDVLREIPRIPDKGLPVTFHDGREEGKIWNMIWTVSRRPGNPPKIIDMYALKGTADYVEHHSLKEDDCLKFFREEATSRYIVNFEKKLTAYVPPLYRNLVGKTWKLIFRKMLSKSDWVAMSLQRLRVEEHLPAVDNRTGCEIKFYDWTIDDQVWMMTLKFTPQKDGRSIYRLTNAAHFLQLHELKIDDGVDFLKSAGPDASYALRAWNLH